MRGLVRGLVVLALVSIAGCRCGGGGIGEDCTTDADCDVGLLCDPELGTCVALGGDAGNMPDSGACVPGAEACNGLDDDCDGTVPPDEIDGDGDGQAECEGDCDDADPTNYTGNVEACGDGTDNDCDGMADPMAFCMGLGTYVSSGTGLDTNPGTQAMPVQTIGQGLINAMIIGGGTDVFVAAGHYPEDVTLVEGISLLGGHDPATWVRDPALNDSAIDNQDDDGVVAPDTITRITLLDGFRINGRTGADTDVPMNAAVSVFGGTPTISNNLINGPEAANFDSAALHIEGPQNDPAGVLVDGNVIVAGDSPAASAAIHLDGTAPVADILNNDLTGANGNRSFGFRSWDSGAGTLVHYNVIRAGRSEGGWSRGIQAQGFITIDDNIVIGGACESPVAWCAGIVVWGATATVTNNVSIGSTSPLSAGCALLEGEVAAMPVTLNGNYCHGGGFPPTGVGANAFGDSAGVVLESTFGNAVTGEIRNNVLNGGWNLNRYGLYEDPGVGLQADPLAFQNNTIFFSPVSFTPVDVLYLDENTMSLTTIAAVNALTDVPMGASGNLDVDPMFVMDNAMETGDYHLSAGSMCIDAGSATGAPPVDFDGEARPMGAGIDIGPDEAM